MSEDADYLFALALQKRYNEENNQIDGNADDIQYVNNDDEDFETPKSISKYYGDHDEGFLNRTQNLVHPEWEVIDPTPDIFSMFKRFNQKFFGSRLECVTLEWSKRMYSCAGICYQRRNRLGMDVTVRLSEPLLKLRPRKDLVETMLHEMIHAYCFVLNIREGNGGHGPNFKKIMYAINKVAGTNITVYHTFNDEVNLYKQHVWRCNGICQDRTPFFGFVKRTSNRAPGPNDQWWQQHMRSCGGTFMKIKEPDKKPKTNAATSNKTKLNQVNAGSGGADLKKYFTINKKDTSETMIKSNKNIDVSKGMSSGTKTMPPKTATSNSTNIRAAGTASNSFQPTCNPSLSSGNLRNVVGFSDLNAASSNSNAKNSIPRVNTSPNCNMSTSGRGYTLNANTIDNSFKSSSNGVVDQNHLRNVWSNRFPNNSPNPISLDVKTNLKRKLSSSENENDDVVIIEAKNDVIVLLSDSDEETFVAPRPTSQNKNMTSKTRQDMIKKEILDESLELSFDDVILIDDEYDDNEAAILAATELADTSVIDEFFGEDTLMAEFQRENDIVPSGSRYLRNPDNDIITCAICQSKMERNLLNEHLNGCMGIIIKIEPPKFLAKNVSKAGSQLSRSLRNTTKEIKTKPKRKNNPNSTTAMESVESERQRRQRNLFKKTRQCSRCGKEFDEIELFNHFGSCHGE